MLESHVLAPEALFQGFRRLRLPGDGVHVEAMVGGDGPPVLLLHGYPQTKVAWHGVAPALARSFTVVLPDLRGYGQSEKPPGDVGHRLYSKRRMAKDQMATMGALGYERFAVIGHDRGARVAARLALDHPSAVQALALLDILPTVDVYSAGMAAAMGLFHWSFLAQPAPLPEMLLAGRTEEFLSWLMDRWSRPGWRPHPVAWAEYVSCLADPSCLHATCEDYRAGWATDLPDDQADLGQRKIHCPTLLLWGSEGPLKQARPLEAWSTWCSRLTGTAIHGGHFFPEEEPEKTAALLQKFLEGALCAKADKPPSRIHACTHGPT